MENHQDSRESSSCFKDTSEATGSHITIMLRQNRRICTKDYVQVSYENVSHRIMQKFHHIRFSRNFCRIFVVIAFNTLVFGKSIWITITGKLYMVKNELKSWMSKNCLYLQNHTWYDPGVSWVIWNPICLHLAKISSSYLVKRTKNLTKTPP